MIEPYVKSFSESELEILNSIMKARCKTKAQLLFQNPLSRKKYRKEDYDFTSQALSDSRDRMGLS